MLESINEKQFNYPETDDIDPEQAEFLYEQHGAILIVENLPTGSEFGIDLSVNRVGEKFKGIKMVPPGMHFIYASAIDKNAQHSGPRVGFFQEFLPKQIVIKRWSTSEEDFDDNYQPSEDEVERYRCNLRDLDRYLGAYKYSLYKKYLNLTDRISPQTTKKLMPTCNRIRSVPFLTRDQPSPSTRLVRRHAGGPNGQDLLPDLQPHSETVIHFTILQDHSDLRRLAQDQTITQLNLDSSMKLHHSFPKPDGRTRLLAELQFSFVVFLLCHVFSCFEHWRDLLELVCKADKLIADEPELYCDFLKILQVQLEQVAEDLFEDIVDSNNHVRAMLDNLFQNIDDCPGAIDELRAASSGLRARLEDRFGWQFGLEAEDEQPVYVET